MYTSSHFTTFFSPPFLLLSSPWTRTAGSFGSSPKSSRGAEAGFNYTGAGGGHGSGSSDDELGQGRESPLPNPLSNNFMVSSRNGSSTEGSLDEDLVDKDVRVKPQPKTSSV